MGDIKLFRVNGGRATELSGSSVALERSLQTLMESNLEALLGVRFLASEYETGPQHRGRVDTLGVDENGSPVIIEYKRATNENVVNQGLFYLDWLLDHKAEFELLVLERLGKEERQRIDWTAPRLVCVAGDFTRYDEYAVKQMNRNVELIRYRRFGEDLPTSTELGTSSRGATMLANDEAHEAENGRPAHGPRWNRHPGLDTRANPGYLSCRGKFSAKCMAFLAPADGRGRWETWHPGSMTWPESRVSRPRRSPWSCGASTVPASARRRPAASRRPHAASTTSRTAWPAAWLPGDRG
ncbi:transporter [Limnochorda pilosa]|uniref:Transporter n=1 Tax=Limnochorda pilosa TaxID=1555112 RepID=A0A0K2SGV3_LIMPI|nr:transporter [Limnochorda pilosa]